MKRCKLFFWVGLTIDVVIVVCFLIIPHESHAMPAFARTYNVNCTICHTRPPRLNPYGERFLENGYQLPGTAEGGILAETQLDTFTLDDITKYVSLRLQGHVFRRFDVARQKPGARIDGSPRDETELTFPEVASVLVAGTFTENIGTFVEVEAELDEDHIGLERGFLTFNNIGKQDVAHLRLGRIDPSAFSSYPTARQQLLAVGEEADENGSFRFPSIDRIALEPAAFAAKFSGLFERDGTPIFPFQPSLYNAVSEIGIDLYGRPFGDWFLYQVGILNGANEEFDDSNHSKDWYMMIRLDHAESNWLSASLSGFAYFGSQNAKISTRDDLDWHRYGLAGNIRYKMVDVYGAYVIDRIMNLPSTEAPAFDSTATGATIEADVLVTDRMLLSLRFDHLDTGGVRATRKSQSLLAVQAKYYLRPDFSLLLRSDVNLRKAEGGVTPERNFRNAFFIGVDLVL